MVSARGSKERGRGASAGLGGWEADDDCDGLTLAGRQVPTKAVLSLPHPQLDRGEKNITKSLRVEIRTGEIIH